MFTLNFKQISTLFKRGGIIFSVTPSKECNVGQFISQILTRDEHGYIELMNPPMKSLVRCIVSTVGTGLYVRDSRRDPRHT